MQIRQVIAGLAWRVLNVWLTLMICFALALILLYAFALLQEL